MARPSGCLPGVAVMLCLSVIAHELCEESGGGDIGDWNGQQDGTNR